MIHLSGVALARGARSLLADASLRIHAGERVGVVGRNGCGKSTLFALLRSQIQPDAGHCEVPADWRIAAMEQEVAASARSALFNRKCPEPSKFDTITLDQSICNPAKESIDYLLNISQIQMRIAFG